MKEKHTGRNAVIIFLVILTAALIVIIYGLPRVYDSMKATYVTEYKTVEQTHKATGYLVRNEKVYASSAAGRLDYKTNEGTKVRKGIRIAALEGGGPEQTQYEALVSKLGDSLSVQDALISDMIGVVSYYADGNEGRFSLDNIKDLRYEDIAELGNDFADLRREETAAGDPVYKIYRNNKWCVVYWTANSKAEKCEPGQRVTVRFEDGEVRATVDSKERQGDKTRIVLSSNLYYKSLAATRTADIKVVLHTYRGLYVMNRSIIEKNGQKGVMVREPSGDYEFTPVNVIYTGTEESIVWANSYQDEKGKQISTIKAYDEILRNP